MSLSDQITADLPYLRRYARALTGSQATGDAYVRSTLEAALEDDALLHQLASGRVALFRAFTKIWTSAHVDDPAPPSDGPPPPPNAEIDVADERLSRITSPGRQALLLTTLEGFSQAQAAEVMGVSESEIEQGVASALEQIARENATEVLVIEDEPLISMQLEQLVEDLGHQVIGTAATRTQALELVKERTPGLVLADIQLADGSSGIDAVSDILAMVDVPVIFITAYPEKLLTGDRPEPTYLISKPFKEDAVRVAISQAMFFGTRAAAN